jgi:hypothetical protein
MIEISKEQLTEFNGFTVYDAVTGDPIEPKDISNHFERLDSFVLDMDGVLWVSPYAADDWKTGLIEVKKEGKYIIQFADGKYMRW